MSNSVDSDSDSAYIIFSDSLMYKIVAEQKV